MVTHEADITSLMSMVDEVRRIHDRTCEPKSDLNPRYHALSNVVSSLTKAADDMGAEDRA